MANMIEFKLSKKQVNRLARENIYLRNMGEVMHAEKMDLASRLLDKCDEYARLLTANEQLRTGMDAIIELARGDA